MLDAIAAERSYLLRVAARRLRNAEQSEDVVQSALVAAVSGVAGFRRQSSMRTWLTSILRNRMIDAHRARRREPLLADLPAQAVRPRRDSGMAPDPAEVVQALELAAALRARLQGLPRASAEAFVMRELEGRSSKEILKRLKLTPSQYWQALHRARCALRTLAL
ncbi:MAG TPA: sigma-70 family RNA polymerase sigma factor [Burkholderiales bacterium]